MYAGIPVFEERKFNSFITAIVTIKNAIAGGYFVFESCLSVLPVVDKLLINDGGSTDGTLEIFKKIRDLYPDKIEILNIPDIPSPHWESIDNALNKMIGLCDSEWIIELQGDEIFHETQIPHIRELLWEVSQYQNPGYNSIRHARWDLSWDAQSPRYSMGTVRIVRNIPGLVSSLGGDHFYVEGITAPDKPREGFTVHNVPLEWDTNEPIIYHFPWVFAYNRQEKVRRIVRELATEDKQRRESYEKGIPDYSFSVLGPHVPAILKGLVGKHRYEVRESLFDKDWLTKTMGMEYHI